MEKRKGNSDGRRVIGRLIRHIPDEQFKTIRYYGVYSRKKKADVNGK